MSYFLQLTTQFSVTPRRSGLQPVPWARVTLTLASPGSVNCWLWHEKACGLWDRQGFERMVLLFVTERADGAKARTERSGLGERAGALFAVAVLARTSQLKVIAKLVPEIAEFWERVNELFRVQWRLMKPGRLWLCPRSLCCCNTSCSLHKHSYRFHVVFFACQLNKTYTCHS